MKHLVAVLSSLGLLSTASLHAQTPIAQEDFTVGATGPLGGTTADLGGTWQATTNFTADGNVNDTTGQRGSAILPFTPNPGFIYELSARVNVGAADATGAAIGIGFTNKVEATWSSDTPAPNAGFRFANTGAAPGLAWQWSINGLQNYVIGPAGANLLGTSTETGTSFIQKTVLDTTGANWVVTFYLDGVQKATTTLAGNGGLNAIDSVGITNFGGRTAGSVQNFLLTEYAPPGVVTPLRIMPLGDSITAGYTDNPAWNHPFQFGYRSGLYNRLANSGREFVFVGSSLEPFNNAFGDPTNGGTYTPPLDLRTVGQNGHRGYGGVNIATVQANVADYMAADTPDVILLLIGVNGIGPGSPAALDSLVNTIFTEDPTVELIVAQIPPKATYDANIEAYNTYISATLLADYAAFSISTVDLYSLFLTNPADKTSIDPTRLANGINHPTNALYDEMAGKWFKALFDQGLIGPDADSDGMTNAFEEAHTDPSSTTSLAPGEDLENSGAGDGLTNLQEFQTGTDPGDVDTDGDTLEDGDEVAGAGSRPRTNPNVADTDGDTLSDLVETNTGTYISAGDTGSSPIKLDSDGDTFRDDYEVAKMTNPNDPNSFPIPALVGYWPFSAAAPIQPDISGYGNNATVTSATWVSDSQRGGVMEFNGNNAFLEAADSASLSLTDNLTIAAWVNVTNYANYRGIVSKSAANGRPAPYDFYLVSSGEPASVGKMRLFAGGSVAPRTSAVSDDPVPTSAWHHIAVVREGTQMRFYLDGALVGEPTVADVALVDDDGTLRIGNRQDLVTDFLGRMDDVAIFDGALDATQITEIMNGDFSEFGVSMRELQLEISQSGGALNFEWNSLSGMQYDIVSSTDLSTPISTWPVYNDGVTTYENIPATGTTTTLTGVLKVGPRRFFSMIEEVMPPLFSENFEAGVGSFTTATNSGSSWAHGDPDSTGLGGSVTTGNGGSTNCFGTNIGNPGFYIDPTNASLRSPVIDLTGVSAATLTFAQALDLDGGDTAVVNIIDDTTDAVIAAAIYTAIDSNAASAVWEGSGAIAIPAAALGQSVRIEWKFNGAGGQFDDYMGWYIDEVLVTP